MVVSRDTDMDSVPVLGPGSECEDLYVSAAWGLDLLVFFRRPCLGMSGRLELGDSFCSSPPRLLCFLSELSFDLEDRLALCLSDLSWLVGDSLDDRCFDDLGRTSGELFEPFSPLSLSSKPFYKFVRSNRHQFQTLK